MSVRNRMKELLDEDRRREYLLLCNSNYSEAVTAAQEFMPDVYANISDPFDELYDPAMRAKGDGDTEGEIRILEKAIQASSKYPCPYERLAVLWDKQHELGKALQVCSLWFDSGFWEAPNSATTSLKMLDRMEKLAKKLGTT